MLSSAVSRVLSIAWSVFLIEFPVYLVLKFLLKVHFDLACVNGEALTGPMRIKF